MPASHPTLNPLEADSSDYLPINASEVWSAIDLDASTSLGLPTARCAKCNLQAKVGIFLNLLICHDILSISPSCPGGDRFVVIDMELYVGGALGAALVVNVSNLASGAEGHVFYPAAHKTLATWSIPLFTPLELQISPRVGLGAAVASQGGLAGSVSWGVQATTNDVRFGVQYTNANGFAAIEQWAPTWDVGGSPVISVSPVSAVTTLSLIPQLNLSLAVSVEGVLGVGAPLVVDTYLNTLLDVTGSSPLPSPPPSGSTSTGTHSGGTGTGSGTGSGGTGTKTGSTTTGGTGTKTGSTTTGGTGTKTGSTTTGGTGTKTGGSTTTGGTGTKTGGSTTGTSGGGSTTGGTGSTTGGSTTTGGGGSTTKTGGSGSTSSGGGSTTTGGTSTGGSTTTGGGSTTGGSTTGTKTTTSLASRAAAAAVRSALRGDAAGAMVQAGVGAGATCGSGSSPYALQYGLDVSFAIGALGFTFMSYELDFWQGCNLDKMTVLSPAQLPCSACTGCT